MINSHGGAFSMKHVKCVVVGDGSVEKVCLCWAYTDDPFKYDEYIPTVFSDYSAEVMVAGQQIEFQLVNTSGSEELELRSLYYVGTDVFVLCFSLVSPVSLQMVESLWVPEIKKYCPNTPYILAGLKSDLRDQYEEHADEFRAEGMEPVSTEEGEKMMRRVRALAYVECSAKLQYNVKEVFETAIKVVLDPPARPLVLSSTKDTESEDGGNCCGVM